VLYHAGGVGLSGKVRPITGTNAGVTAPSCTRGHVHGREEGLMRGLSVLVAVLFTSVASPGVGEEASPPPTQHPALAQWLPFESYPGGKQSDPRLDQPVRFWGAGIPLKQVYEGIHEQTGVEVGFWPPGDMNERVCVNLYLNPDKPPSLRELLVQLAWVTDCAFAWERGAGECRYALLGTSMGDGAIERLLEQADRVQSERNRVGREIQQEVRDRTIERIGDLRQALRVPRDQLVARYKGKDDLLLLATLDPARRAASEFLTTLSGEDLAKIQPGETLELKWSDLTAEQRAMLRDAIPAAAWQGIQPHLPVVSVGLTFFSGVLEGGVGFPTGPGSSYGVVLPLPQLVVDNSIDGLDESYVESQAALRRALGEKLDLAEIMAQERERSASRARARRQQQAQEQLQRQRRLREDSEALLASIPLPLDIEKPFALWQLQELVASRSGVHIVSDCLWQPERPLRPGLERLYADSQPELTALAVVRAATVAQGPGIAETVALYRDLGVTKLTENSVSWEWGDAGQFLHFRDRRRDACREVFLPEEALNVLDSWVDAELPDDETDSQPEVTVPLDPRACGRVFALLSGPQARYGWYLTYGDPSDWRNAYRNAFREQFRRVIEDEHFYRLVARLTDEQWELLSTVGLRWGRDVSLLPSAVETSRYWGTWPGYEDGDLLELLDRKPSPPARGFGGPILDDGSGLTRMGVTSMKWFQSDRTYGMFVPLGLTVKPRGLERLVGTPNP
jgi:hypothetical protein